MFAWWRIEELAEFAAACIWKALLSWRQDVDERCYCCLNVTVEGYHNSVHAQNNYMKAHFLNVFFFLLSMSYDSQIVLACIALLTGTFEVFYTFKLSSQIFASEDMKSLIFQNVTPWLTEKSSLPLRLLFLSEEMISEWILNVLLTDYHFQEKSCS